MYNKKSLKAEEFINNEEILKTIGYVAHPEDRGGCGVVRGKRQYSRILIRNKHPKQL